MVKKIAATLMVVALLLELGACKKGEDDPAVSLRTRRARVEGEWRLYKGNVIVTTVDYAAGARLNQLFALDGTRYTLTQTSSTPQPDIFRGGYLLSFTCEKDGSFTLSERIANYSIEATGTWAFNAKSAGKKNKEYLNMNIKSIKSGKTNGPLFNQASTNFTYRIKELRNKKMVLEVEADIYVDAGNFEQTYYGEYTLIQ